MLNPLIFRAPIPPFCKDNFRYNLYAYKLFRIYNIEQYREAVSQFIRIVRADTDESVAVYKLVKGFFVTNGDK